MFAKIIIKKGLYNLCLYAKFEREFESFSSYVAMDFQFACTDINSGSLT